MAASNTVASRIAVLVVLAPALVGAWFAAPYFLPLWRWQNIDFEALGRQGVKADRQYEAVFRFAERGPDDPVAWQLLEMKPAWGEEEEVGTIVRATVVSDRSGEPISSLKLGSGHFKDRYFTAMVWRFPPGSFGFNAHRPVVVFEHQTLAKLDTSGAVQWEETAGTPKAPKWPSDDEDVDDGYVPPGSR